MPYRHTKFQFDVLSWTDDMFITFDLSLNIIPHFFFHLAMTFDIKFGNHVIEMAISHCLLFKILSC